VADLACSLDGLYGCIELINEGRPAPVTRIMRDLEKSIITQAMTMSQANIRGAAALLGIKYTTLYAKIRKHGLRFSKAVRFAPASAEADARFLGR
jgi:transcriptional regulator of acetoin/glycerol metabolism